MNGHFWRRHREWFSWLATLLGTIMWRSCLPLALLLIGFGIWVLILRPLWLNWNEDQELLKEFPKERLDRPIPFTTRCSQMRYYSPLPPEELWKALETEIVASNEELVQWQVEEGETFQWNAEWKSVRKGNEWTLTLFRRIKGEDGGTQVSAKVGTGGAGFSLWSGINFFWTKCRGATFRGRIEPWESGSILRGCFSAAPLLNRLWFPAIWVWAGLFLCLYSGQPEWGPLCVLVGINSMLDRLGRGAGGIEELTLETQKALINFFGEPEVLE